jgi:hypothetical protein
MPADLTYTPVLKEQIEPVVSEGVFTYMHEYFSRVFPDHTHPGAQDCIATGVADAIRRYEQLTGVPIAQTIAQNLMDTPK